MPISRRLVDGSCFTPTPVLPFELRLLDFESAMQDVYDFFRYVNDFLIGKGLPRLEETLRAANLSGTVSDMLTASLASAHGRWYRTTTTTGTWTSSCKVSTLVTGFRRVSTALRSSQRPRRVAQVAGFELCSTLSAKALPLT